MSEMDAFRDMFFVECDELLEGLATGLRAMDVPDHDKETVHAVFRAVHSVKGGAAAFALDDLVAFAHRFETVLDLVRSDKLPADPKLMQVMHKSSDCLADLVTAARSAQQHDQSRLNTLQAELDDLIGTEDEADTGFVFAPISIDVGPAADAETDTDEGAGFKICFAPEPELYWSGNDPSALLFALAKLGAATIALKSDTVPVLEDWCEDQTNLTWEIQLLTERSKADVAAVFEFVEDCCHLHIQPLIEEPAANDDTGAMPEPASETAGDQAAAPAQSPAGAVKPAAPVSAPVQPPAAEPSPTIRVNLERVDRLMNMIGELVIKEAMLSQVIRTAGMMDDPDVVSGLDAIRQLSGDIQESVMAIRAQPLKLIFQRMHRILREAADATGKHVQLVATGEQTEVDKTMIERLVDPLTHMIRNSVDHGLEDSETRERNGKSAMGTITLSAAHRSGRVQIEVSDDGGGIDRARVQTIAEEKGLIAEGANLSAGEIDQLLFLPGFSSKQEVSALSGRGVGLDVVRREIMDLGGRVMINSVEGEGTTFSIALPLTLAVLEGMLIQLCGQTMVLPITAIQETLRPNANLLHGVGQAGRLLSSRGELIPIIDLGNRFGLRDRLADLSSGVLIVIESDSQKRAALHVDGILDQRQVVIKSLEDNYGQVAGVSAATILGDGKIALIVDPEEIIQSSACEHHSASSAFTAFG